MPSCYVVPWEVVGCSSPHARAPCMVTRVSGWDELDGVLRTASTLSDLPFLTPRGVAALRDAVGDDYGVVDLFADVVARGSGWLPHVFGDDDGDAYDAIYRHFRAHLMNSVFF